ncbi:MAG: serine hydrolase domain-containing protein [Pseudomonadota bacterium]
MFRVFATVLLVSSLVVAGGFARADVSQVSDTRGPDQAHTLEAFVDGLVRAHMTEHDLPGLTISVVKDGKPLLVKGYGYADLEAREPVDANTHIFRLGSVSKAFTWVAIMQLVERGLLDLDADINTYLEGIEISYKGSVPITLTHLMTHTAGFEDMSFTQKVFVGEAGDIPTRLDYLTRYPAAQVRPAGQVSSYSNYGVNLAGYIIECVTGLSYPDYIERHIFLPLGMTSSTFREDVGADNSDSIDPGLLERRSKSYELRNGLYRETPEYFLSHWAPPAGLQSTAGDMARFMIAFAGDGSYKGQRILKQETLQLMHRRNHGHAANLNGVTHGLIENHIGDVRAIGHGGYALHFLSSFYVVPEAKLGVFLSYNVNTAAAPRGILEDIIRYLTGTFERPERLEPKAEFAERVQRFEGSYLGTRRSHTNLEKVMALNWAVRISTTDDGYLIRHGFGPATRFVETAPLQFRSVDGEERLAFRENEAGRITHLFTSNPVNAYERLSRFETRGVFLQVLFLSIALAVSTVVSIWFRRFQIGTKTEATNRTAFWLSALGAVTAGTLLAYLASFVFAMAAGFDDLMKLGLDWPTVPIRISQWIGLVFAAAASLQVLSLPIVFTRLGVAIDWSVSRRIHYAAFSLSAALLVILLNHWNMIGFRY